MRALIILLAARAIAADAQTPAPDIVVTGRALSDLPGARAYGGVTLDAAALAVPSGRLEVALAQVAGVQLFRRSDSRAANPTSQGVTLRALGGNAASRALVTLDGVPQIDPFAGWVPWAALSQTPIQSARITRGGGAGPFGAGALSGTIALTSPDVDAPGRLDAALGGRDAARADAQVGVRLGDGALRLSGGFDRGDGFLLPPAEARGAIDVPARYRQWSVAARAVAPLAGGEAQARVALFDDRRLRGLPGTDARNSGADATLRYVGREAWGVEALVYAQLRDFATRTVVADAARTGVSTALDQFRTPATGWGGKLALRRAGRVDVEFGADWRAADGVTHERFRYVAGAATRLRRAGGRTLIAGAYVEADAALREGLRLTGGARVDHWRLRGGFLDERNPDGAPTAQRRADDRSGWRPTARAGLLWQPLPAWTARAAVYAGWRLPTLNELHRPFRIGNDITLANAALRPERSAGVEAELEFRPLPTARLSVTGYWNRLHDPVANVTVGQGPGQFADTGFVPAGGVVRQRRNLRAIRVAGVEADARLELARWTLRSSLAWNAARVDGGADVPVLDGLRPAQSPALAVSASAAWRGERMQARITARHAGAQFEDDLNQRRLRPATVIDADAAWRLIEGVALTLELENLADATIEVGHSTPERGQPRTLWLGLRLGGL